jgi:UDP-N-acetylmuramoyl-tripeptide--D-alanyl-D-alanine ligase
MGDPILMTIRSLADAVGGEVYPQGIDPSLGFSSVSIDSRTVAPGALFVALIGSSQDGHAYVDAAFASGARIALVARSRWPSLESALRPGIASRGSAAVIVENTLAALQAAAARYVAQFPGLLKIGITGSSGKTTTKELAAAMIAGERSVVMNQGNLNSETGLPLSVFGIRSGHQVGIFEMGMNRVGEIGELAGVLRPDIALITNIGTAHIGILGSADAIAKEKKDIFSRFDGAQVALVPEEDPYAAYLSENVRGRVRPFGPRSLSSYSGSRDLGLDGTEILWAGQPARLCLPGAHNLANALAAAAAAEEAGVSPAAIRKGIESLKPLFGRSELFRGPVTLVRDCYNANPESVRAAVDFCDSVEWPGRRIYIIGSMLELGSLSEPEHRSLGKALKASKADLVLLFGSHAECARDAWDRAEQRVFWTEDMDSLKRKVSEILRPGDLVLLKGSRGVALERLGEEILSSRYGGAAEPKGA